MKKYLLTLSIILCGLSVQSQMTSTDSTTNEPLNSVNNIIRGNSGKAITLGTYAQIDYNQIYESDIYNNGKLDIHRMVIFLGYKFGDRTHFVTEIELEHVTEVYVEQAFLNYQILPQLNFRAGLMLIPMGIINEYHEPTTYNGVERPNIDGKIVPTTWREMGVGFAGNFPSYALKYQVYVVNGFNGYSNGTGVLRGSDAFRKGRQKAAESYMSSPNLSTKIDYYGLPGLKVGLAGYFGKSQSELFDGLDKNDFAGNLQADSSVVNLSMIGLDARYELKGFKARAQVISANIGNTKAYNTFTGKDLGAELFGYYVEASYDVLRLFNLDTKKELNLFTRYEEYNTHHKVTDELQKNTAYSRTDITIGLGFKLTPGSVLKADYQILKNDDDTLADINQLNFGVGVWF
ncbi:MAG: hypothetical protein OEW67_11325 [Cyclobacteriaceae bacterium]|nr:hypothetical protein [Cyclobacteriaceae bacterium]